MEDVRARPFAHVDAPNSQLYRRIMRIFAAKLHPVRREDIEALR